MKFCLVVLGLENLPGYLEHDSPRVTFSVLLMLPGWKINSQTGVFVAHLTGPSVKVVTYDVIEHHLVHQDVEDRVITSLVDQRPCLERLIKALLDHPDDHQIRFACVLGLTRERNDPLSPFWLASLRHHHVEQLHEVLAVIIGAAE